MKNLAFALLSFLSFCALYAQPEIPFHCGFDDFLEQQLSQAPGFASFVSGFDAQLAEKSKQTSTISHHRQTYVIPVVVHIVSPPGTIIGEGNNLSFHQIDRGISMLNEAFANAGPFYAPDGVNTGISFCLARQTPEGEPSTGVTRHETELVAGDWCSPFSTDKADAAQIKSLVVWDCKQYLNIWLVTDLYSSSYGCGLAGFATFPGTDCTSDGIMVESRYWLNPNGISIVAHEAGHYFGLYHTFHNGCQNDDCLTDGDRVCDTPPDASQPFAPCNTNSCQTDAPDLPDDNTNYMDYSSCGFTHFTEGQNIRMLNALEISRSGLIHSTRCEPLLEHDLAILQIDQNCISQACPRKSIRNMVNEPINQFKLSVSLEGVSANEEEWTEILLPVLKYIV